MQTLQNLNGTDLTVIYFALKHYSNKLNVALTECDIPECKSRHITYLQKCKDLIETIRILEKNETGY